VYTYQVEKLVTFMTIGIALGGQANNPRRRYFQNVFGCLHAQCPATST